tara:strand:+ start:120 stop:635 length:516 start_codon:yes stop_codon:yes gene_type:complete
MCSLTETQHLTLQKEESVCSIATNAVVQEGGYAVKEHDTYMELTRLFQSLDSIRHEGVPPSNLKDNIGKFINRGITSLDTLRKFLNDKEEIPINWLKEEDEDALKEWYFCRFGGGRYSLCCVARYDDVVRVEQEESRGEWYEERYPTIQELQSISIIQRGFREYLHRKSDV